MVRRGVRLVALGCPLAKAASTMTVMTAQAAGTMTVKTDGVKPQLEADEYVMVRDRLEPKST